MRCSDCWGCGDVAAGTHFGRRVRRAGRAGAVRGDADVLRTHIQQPKDIPFAAGIAWTLYYMMRSYANRMIIRAAETWIILGLTWASG